jgi:hypothetical protein
MKRKINETKKLIMTENKHIARPKELIEQWVTLFNQCNANALAELYHENCINHQVMNDPVVGKENIRKMFENDFAVAEMVCIIENIFEDHEWAILEWRDPLGLRGCGFFQVIDGKIKFQRGYWDKLSFFRQHNLPIPPV